MKDKLWRNFQCESRTNGYFSSYINKLHIYHAKEYLRFVNDLGEEINKSHSPPYSPELNSISERVNRAISDYKRSMLIQSNLPICFWPFVVKHIVYICNHIPHSTPITTPFLLVTNKNPNLDNFRVFVCASYVLKLPQGSKF